jgi:hypothetical protein
MISRLEWAGGTSYRYTPDRPRRTADHWRAIAQARVLDEITRETVRHPIHVTAGHEDLVVRAGSDGMIGVVGRPGRIFPALAVTGAALQLTIAVPGYLPLELAGTLGPIAGFPDAFAHLDFGDALLHRPGVVLAGRVVENVAGTPPIPGAAVRIEGMWSTLPPPNWTPPALQEPANLISLAPGLYAPRAAAAAIVRRDLVLSLQAKTMIRPLSAGATRALISDRVGLAAGGVLAIDRDDAARLEAIELTQVDTTSTLDQPAWVTLAHAAKHLHREGAVCTAAAPQPPQAPTTFTRSGIAGDCVAILNVAPAPAFASGVFVEIDDGAAPREFQRIERFETATDAGGFFRLPPIARVAFVRVRVQHGGFSDSTPILTIDYRSAVQRLTVAME